MARKITKKVIPNNLREDWNKRSDDPELLKAQEITIEIKNSSECATTCPYLSDCFGKTYGCDLCIEEVGRPPKRLKKCKEAFGE